MKFNLDVPVLDVGSQRGDTDYIDFLNWEDIPNSVMKGLDIDSREFLAFKLGLKIIKEDGSEKMKYFTQVFFQRHSYDKDNWVSACPDFVKMFDIMSQEDFEFVEKLAKGECLNVDETQGFYGKLPSSKYYLAHYDYWREQGCQN